MEMVEGEHNLGIDFKAWEQHLKQMEQENLAIKKLQRLQKIKVENGEKREYERQLKEQQNKEIEDTREEVLILTFLLYSIFCSYLRNSSTRRSKLIRKSSSITSMPSKRRNGRDISEITNINCTKNGSSKISTNT